MGRILEHYGRTILVGPRPAQIGWKTTKVNGELHQVKVYESLTQTIERLGPDAPPPDRDSLEPAKLCLKNVEALSCIECRLVCYHNGHHRDGRCRLKCRTCKRSFVAGRRSIKGQLEWKLEALLKEAFLQGGSHRQTARRLKLRVSTVRNHFYKLRAKLGTPQRQCGSPSTHVGQPDGAAVGGDGKKLLEGPE